VIHLADADDFQKISHYPRHDRLPPAIALVGPPVTEVRHDGRNARCAGAATGVCQSQKFDQVITYGRRRRLHEKDFLTAYGFEQPHRHVAVRIPLHQTATDRNAKHARDHCCQRGVGCAGENRERIVHACLCADAWVAG